MWNRSARSFLGLLPDFSGFIAFYCKRPVTFDFNAMRMMCELVVGVLVTGRRSHLPLNYFTCTPTKSVVAGGVTLSPDRSRRVVRPLLQQSRAIDQGRSITKHPVRHKNQVDDIYVLTLANTFAIDISFSRTGHVAPGTLQEINHAGYVGNIQFRTVPIHIATRTHTTGHIQFGCKGIEFALERLEGTGGYWEICRRSNAGYISAAGTVQGNAKSIVPRTSAQISAENHGVARCI